jgi:hypothetical protein
VNILEFGKTRCFDLEGGANRGMYFGEEIKKKKVWIFGEF